MLVNTTINGRVLSPKMQRELEAYETLGFDRQHFFMFRKKWYSIKATSNQKGREFSLTFEEFGLDKTGVAKMLRGNIQKHKNWTGGYINGV